MNQRVLVNKCLKDPTEPALPDVVEVMGVESKDTTPSSSTTSNELAPKNTETSQVSQSGIESPKKPVSEEGGNNPETIEDKFLAHSWHEIPDLARVVVAWPKLPEHIKSAICALIATQPQPKG